MKTDNELIAEFMGGVRRDITNKHYLQGEPPFYVYDLPDKKCLQPPNFGNYQTSWDWLIPVVNKIESLSINGYHFYTEICTSGCKIAWCIRPTGSKKPKTISIHGTNKMQTTYQAAIDFIKWYNENKKS